MAKRVKVVLTESIATLGRDGDVIEVAPGYARNFLLPFGKKVKKYLPFFIGFKLLTFTGFLTYLMNR